MGSFSVFHWLIVLLVIFLLYKVLSNNSHSTGNTSGAMICPNCGTQGEPKIITKGSLGMEIILWICFLLPGLIYSIWRLSSRYSGCPSCGQPGMIGINTPNGRFLADKFKNI